MKSKCNHRQCCIHAVYQKCCLRVQLRLSLTELDRRFSFIAQGKTYHGEAINPKSLSLWEMMTRTGRVRSAILQSRLMQRCVLWKWSLLRAYLICCFLNGHAEPLDIPLIEEQPDQCARSGYNIRPMHAGCFDLSFSGVANPGRQSLHLKH